MVKLSSYQDKAIVLIDGECDFCNRTALFIIKYDKKDKFRFASQQSEVGKYLLQKNNY
ncbi:thiol-disulfide oxidoreductase DCC family protein, partial [Flavobacterium macrobrachii]